MQRLTLPLALAAVGCTNLTTIGWSSEHQEKLDAPSIVPRHATAVVAPRSELLQPGIPSLGDIDGDGFDDFLLMSSQLQIGEVTDNAPPPTLTAYLFYGKPSFPEHLQVQDADATFESGAAFNYPLGDINGDGFADFALADAAGYEFIFGSSERLSGRHEKLSTGKVVWTYEPKPIPGNPGLTSQLNDIIKLGDTNADGYDDFAVRVIEPTDDENDVSGAFSYAAASDFIILGRKDNWPTGAWDPRWAAADFGYDKAGTPQYAKLSVVSCGDFDGDGFRDLVAQGWERQWIFYGKRAGFSGTLSPDTADAQATFARSDWPFALGDFDGDGIDDLTTFGGLNELNIFYGSHQRYSGSVTPKPDLTFLDQGPYNNPVLGDYNGDGRADLVFVGNSETRHLNDWGDLSEEDHFVVYQVKGTAKRLTGRVQLTSNDIYAPIGYATPAVLDNNGGFNLNPGGDFDGDGSSDLIVGAPGQTDPADSYVVLLPGAARTPD